MPGFVRYCGIAWVVAGLSSFGCSSSDDLSRVLVSGSVTYDGKAVEKGQIRFIPQDGSRGPITITSIDQGRYSTDATGGVPVGSHRVEIKGYDAHEYETAPSGPGSPPVKQRLPEKYNLQSELTVSLQEDSDERLDFNLMR